jgi:hypothetical protein
MAKHGFSKIVLEVEPCPCHHLNGSKYSGYLFFPRTHHFLPSYTRLFYNSPSLLLLLEVVWSIGPCSLPSFAFNEASLLATKWQISNRHAYTPTIGELASLSSSLLSYSTFYIKFYCCMTNICRDIAVERSAMVDVSLVAMFVEKIE